MGSIIWGIVGTFFTLFGLIPLLGFMNWLSIPCLAIGLLCGIIGICKKPKEKRGTSIAGTIICILFLLVAGWRTYIGWSATKKALAPASMEKLQKTSDDLNKLSDSLNKLNDIADSLKE